MNDFSIVEMTENHLEDVLNISGLSFNIPWSRDSYEKELKNPLAKYLTAINGDKVLGYGGMWIIIDEAHITNIAVAPLYRQQGIGASILEAMIKKAEEQGVTAMTLEVRSSNLAAQKLYHNFGFINKGIRKAYYEDNHEDAVIMWKFLSESPS